MFETAVDSFILRFVREQNPATGGAQASWHGVIRHLHSNEQIRFTKIEAALLFMDDYVVVDDKGDFFCEMSNLTREDEGC